MAKKAQRRKKSAPRKKTGRSWSRRVMETSDALDLKRDVFKREPRAIAASLKRSASRRTRARSKARSDFQAAMSMLNFYINRAGRNLPKKDRTRLERAKGELRKMFGRDASGPRRGRTSGRGH